MKQTVVGVFERYESARHAADLLAESGFGPDAVQVTQQTTNDADLRTEGSTETGVMASIRHFFSGLFGNDDRDVAEYAEALRRGGAVVKVDVAEEPQVELARETLSSAGAIDIDARAAEWRQSGWSGLESSTAQTLDATASGGTLGALDTPPAGTTGLAAGTSALGTSATGTLGGTATTDKGVIPVVQEELEVGKRTVSTGGVRVYARTVSEPVEETLTLREERAAVERRSVDRPATAADTEAFTDRTIEVRESVEKPVVTKTARVVEEVSVGKEVSQHTETVRDTVRHTEVEVDELPASASAKTRDFSSYDDEFRQHWQTEYGSGGGTYAEYEPAYRYGHSLAGDARYAGRPWEDVEATARTKWETQHPGSAWERMKGAVRHAWQRVTS